MQNSDGTFSYPRNRKNIVKYRVTHCVLTTNTTFRDFDTLEEALEFDTKRLQMDMHFIEKYQNNYGKARISKVSEIELKVEDK